MAGEKTLITNDFYAQPRLLYDQRTRVMINWLKGLFKTTPQVLELPDSKKYDPELNNVIKMKTTKSYIGSLQYYADVYARCQLNPRQRDLQEFTLKHIIRGRPEYEKIQAVVGLDWWVVGAIHGLECSFNWTRILHNGQPLGQVTTIKPIGLGPFNTWGEAAINALVRQGAHKEFSWSIESILQFTELYNGLGYLKKYPKRMSPYIWASTNIETKGKYIEDHVYDENAVSSQVGVAAVALLLTREKIITPQFVCSGLIKN